MTQFERWKEKFDVESFIYAAIHSCRICPLEDSCCGSLEVQDCYELLKEWANKECEE